MRKQWIKRSILPHDSRSKCKYISSKFIYCYFDFRFSIGIMESNDEDRTFLCTYYILLN